MDLETDRLYFKEITDDDFDNLKSIICDPFTMKYYPCPYDDKGVQRWIDWCKGCYAKRGFGLFGVYLKSNNKFIGDCGITLQNIHGNEVFEIGYHIHKDYWNNGYASEASQFFKKYFFRNEIANEVYSFMNKDNIASRKVAIKNGMSLVDSYYQDNEELVVYKITLEEFIRKGK